MFGKPFYSVDEVDERLDSGGSVVVECHVCGEVLLLGDERVEKKENSVRGRVVFFCSESCRVLEELSE